MVSREIVRHPDILAGQWRFDGTLIAIRDLRHDFRDRPDSARAAYLSMGLTHAEIDAALAFDFPPIGDLLVEPKFVELALQCVCGEHREVTLHPPAFETTPCICGRSWRAEVGLGEGRGGAARAPGASP